MGVIQTADVTASPRPPHSRTSHEESRDMRTTRTAMWIAAAAVVLAACGGSSTTDTVDTSAPPPLADDSAATTTPTIAADDTAYAERMAAIDEAVAIWRNAATVVAAQAAAEAAANLIVGPTGPDYGDRDGDGVVSGEAFVGLLPGLEGTPAGLAKPLAPNACISADVLGGSWDDPEAEWGAMQAAIDAWRPDNNTMPTLASHPMRVVGWATFTLGSDSLDDAHEYAGHAKLHVDISIRALDC